VVAITLLRDLDGVGVAAGADGIRIAADGSYLRCCIR